MDEDAKHHVIWISPDNERHTYPESFLSWENNLKICGKEPELSGKEMSYYFSWLLYDGKVMSLTAASGGGRFYLYQNALCQNEGSDSLTLDPVRSYISVTNPWDL